MRAPLKNDAAPLAGGAGVKNRTILLNFTQPVLTPSACIKALTGSSAVAANRNAEAKDLRARVLAFIVRHGLNGATDHEGEAGLGIEARVYASMRQELVALHLVVNSGRWRSTANGRPAAVWVARTLAATTHRRFGQSTDDRKPEGGAP
ncbi:MAG: hypothetical protein KIT24_11625 [Phycisphaeraceae bacterium]|nr:hypothetical protein [Phycisphaeraceae bacterium]